MQPRLGIISKLIHSFQGERTISGIYHLLRGRKSTQTIQDGAFFSLLRYFRLFPSLTRTQLEKDVAHLVQSGHATYVDEERVILTAQGEKKLKLFLQKRPHVASIDGWTHHTYAETVWLRLALYIQTLTHVTAKESFYPLTHDMEIQTWTKRVLPKRSATCKEHLTMIHNELAHFLSSCSNEQATIFVHQLSGKDIVGYTQSQLAEKMNIHLVDVYLYHVATLHQFCSHIQDKNTYPLLHMCMDRVERNAVSASAKETFTLLQKGHSLSSICRRRKLKRSTIEDHIIELALYGYDVSARLFVSEEVESQIIAASKKLQTNRLRKLKEHLPDNVTYFAIRFVLAQRKVQNET